MMQLEFTSSRFIFILATVQLKILFAASEEENNIISDSVDPLLVQDPLPAFYARDDDFIRMTEFDYGQRAFYGEPCDLAAFNKLVLPIFHRAIKEDGDPPTIKKTWLGMQQNYVIKLMNDKQKTLRSKTCQGDHLMQCSTTTDASGNNTCECLNIEPIYQLEFDLESDQCRAKNKARCFSPFGFHCLTGSACRQHASGKCFCEQSDPEDPLQENCQGLDK